MFFFSLPYFKAKAKAATAIQLDFAAVRHVRQSIWLLASNENENLNLMQKISIVKKN